LTVYEELGKRNVVKKLCKP